MITLAIEASTYAGSVAVVRDGAVLEEATVAMRGEREERLMPAVADALTSCGIAPNAIDRVVCGAGPGSFTSLRIAGAIAKGLALAAGAPLYPVSSLMLVVAGAQPPLTPGRYVVATDAMRGDVFAEAFTVTAGSISTDSPTMLVAKTDLDGFAREHSARLVGPDEANPSSGRISFQSPLGRSLMKRKVGDVVLVLRGRRDEGHQRGGTTRQQHEG